MKNSLSLLKAHYESLLFLVAVCLLLLALIKPEIQLKQEVHNYLLLADVSQSMNAEDIELNGQPISRLAHTRHLMKQIVKTSSCGTYVSVGIFAAENVALLFMPLEVCANFDIITDSIDKLEWRMAWAGNSRITFGIKAAEATFDYLNVPAQLLFFTDGDEAPKANAINKLDISNVRIGKNVVFVGVGGPEFVPIKRYNTNNEYVGYWGSDVAQEVVGASVTYSDASVDEPDPPVAHSEYDRWLTKLDADYLKELAKEINGQYVEGIDKPEFYQFVESQTPAAKFVTAYSLRWLYLLLAALAVLGTYSPDILYRFKHKRKGNRASKHGHLLNHDS